MSFSLCINHTPWIPARVEALAAMSREIGGRVGVPTFIHDTDYRGEDWQGGGKLKWMQAQWNWSVAQKDCAWHIFLTDDLHIMPRFWSALSAMCSQAENLPIGLLSNHPGIPDLRGFHWYRTSSWITGPGYVLPHAFLVGFLEWFNKMPDHPHTKVGTKSYQNDDSNINEYISSIGGCAIHPLPTIIEHRHDLPSTVGHGDKFSRERLSWRAKRWTEDTGNGGFEWKEEVTETVRALGEPSWWVGASTAPMMRVGA